VFPVDKQITSALAEVFQWDACQGRAMVRCPLVPVRLFMYFSSINRIYVLLP